MQTQPTRRALLGGAGLASVALVAPAIAAIADVGSADFRTLLSANDAARHRFNTLPRHFEFDEEEVFDREEKNMLAAGRAADRAVPTNWQEFVRLLAHMSDDGLSDIDGDNGARLLTHAQHLLDKGATA